MHAAATIVLAGILAAQTPADEGLSWRILTGVRAAMAAALSYPASDPEGIEPADGRAAAPWMVRPLDPARPAIEVIANPLNADQQTRAAAAMAEIAAAVDAAQRRSQAQYDRAVDEARRTGRSQEVDGVTLDDEGVAGARIDWESRLTIEVEHNLTAYRFTVASGVRPAPGEVSLAAAAAVVNVPANVYRDRSVDEAVDRYCPAETLVFLGTEAPRVHDRSATSFEIAAVAPAGPGPGRVASLVVRLRGNEALVASVLRRTEWDRVAALVER